MLTVIQDEATGSNYNFKALPDQTSAREFYDINMRSLKIPEEKKQQGRKGTIVNSRLAEMATGPSYDKLCWWNLSL